MNLIPRIALIKKRFNACNWFKSRLFYRCPRSLATWQVLTTTLGALSPWWSAYQAKHLQHSVPFSLEHIKIIRRSRGPHAMLLKCTVRVPRKRLTQGASGCRAWHLRVNGSALWSQWPNVHPPLDAMSPNVYVRRAEFIAVLPAPIESPRRWACENPMQ